MFSGRKFRVEVDGVEVGALRRGDHLTAPLAAGEHRVRVFVGDPTSKLASSQTVTVRAGSTGSASLVARPADVDPAARTERFALRDPVAIELVEGDDVSRSGPTLGQMYRARPPSLGAPARTPTQRVWWLVGLALALAGFILLPLVRNGIGFFFLVAGVVILAILQIGYLRSRKRP